jgi:hypothetical protein
VKFHMLFFWRANENNWSPLCLSSSLLSVAPVHCRPFFHNFAGYTDQSGFLLFFLPCSTHVPQVTVLFYKFRFVLFHTVPYLSCIPFCTCLLIPFCDFNLTPWVFQPFTPHFSSFLHSLFYLLLRACALLRSTHPSTFLFLIF